MAWTVQAYLSPKEDAPGASEALCTAELLQGHSGGFNSVKKDKGQLSSRFDSVKFQTCIVGVLVLQQSTISHLRRQVSGPIAAGVVTQLVSRCTATRASVNGRFGMLIR